MPKIAKREDLLFGTIDPADTEQGLFITGIQTRTKPVIQLWLNDTVVHSFTHDEAVRLANAILNYQVEPIPARKHKFVKKYIPARDYLMPMEREVSNVS